MDSVVLKGEHGEDAMRYRMETEEGQDSGYLTPAQPTATTPTEENTTTTLDATANEQPPNPFTPTSSTDPTPFPPLSPTSALIASIVNNDIPTLTALLSASPPIPLEFETLDNYTPLTIALCEANVTATRLLLSHGASPHHRAQGLPPLVYAATSQAHSAGLLKLLLSHGAVLNGVSGPDGKTALQWAASEGYVSAVEFLARQPGVELDGVCKGNMTAVVLAAREGHEDVIKVLWACGADIVRGRGDNGGTAMHWGAARGDVGVVEFLIGKGVELEERDVYGNTALTLAGHFGHEEAVEVLIAAGADVNAKRNEPKDATPLMTAAAKNQAAVVKKLIAHGADIHAVAADGCSALDVALLHRSQDAANVLLEAIGGEEYPKESVAVQLAMATEHATIMALMATASVMYSYMEVQVGEPDKHAWVDWVLKQGGDLVRRIAMAKMLHAALKDHDVDMVKTLIMHGCDVNRRLESGATPLAYAVIQRHIDLVEVLLQAGADPNQSLHIREPGSSPGEGEGEYPEWTIFEHIVVRMHAQVEVYKEFVDLLLESGRCRINRGANGTAFSYVLDKIKQPRFKDMATDLAKRMVASVRDVDADRDDRGYTLLHVAAHSPNLWMVDILLDRGADINAIANDGTTPFLLVCRNNPDFAQKLLERGANPKAKLHKSNANALHAMAALGRPCLPLIDTLVLDINEQTLSGYTPLACALNWGHETLSLILMDRGAHMNWKTDRNETALHLAARNGLHRALEEILKYGIDVNAADTRGWLSLHEACATGSVAVVTQLLDAGADIERPLPNGDRPLHVALSGTCDGREDIALLLLGRGADVTAVGSKERTALHLAAEFDLPRAVKALLESCQSTDLEAVDEETWTPLCCARNPEVIRLLLEAGADIHYADKDGWTPLHQAVHAGDTEAALILVQAGASVEPRTTDDGLTVRERAVDMWKWSEKRQVVRPKVLKMAAMQREQKERKEAATAAAEDEPEALGGAFEIVYKND